MSSTARSLSDVKASACFILTYENPSQRSYLQSTSIGFFNYLIMTWFHVFDKTSWSLRIWRKVNLKFNQDQYGMSRVKYMSWFKDLYLRFARSQGGFRFTNFVIGIALIIIIKDFNKKYIYQNVTKPKKLKEKLQLEKLNEEARKKLFHNRLGIPSRPNRTIQDLVTFLQAQSTYQQLSDFNTYQESQNVNADISKGLDTWATDQDKNMIKYYIRGKANEHH